MGIKSMTGFARAEGSHDGAAWHWEVRSVNGRGLDVRLRLPSGAEQLEPRVREIVARHVSRGSVTINLSWSATKPAPRSVSTSARWLRSWWRPPASAR